MTRLTGIVLACAAFTASICISSAAHATQADDDPRYQNHPVSRGLGRVASKPARRSVPRHAARASLTDANGNLVMIRTPSGKTALVAARAASAFQGFINEFEGAGYRIAFIGGWRRHGSVRHSLHPAGLAIDICQTGRNRVACKMPPNVSAMAARHGLFHGALWCNRDGGHFELASASRAGACGTSMVARRKHHRRPHYASAP